MNLDQASTLRLKKEQKESALSMHKSIQQAASPSLPIEPLPLIEKKQLYDQKIQKSSGQEACFFVPEEPQQLLLLLQEIKGLIELGALGGVLLIAPSDKAQIYAKGLQKTIVQLYGTPVSIRGGLLGN